MHGRYLGTCDRSHSFAKFAERASPGKIGNFFRWLGGCYCISHSRPPVRILRPVGIGTAVSDVSLWITMLPFPVIWNWSAMKEVHGEGAKASAVPVTVTSCLGR